LDQSLQVTRPDYRLENEFNPTTNPPTGRRLHRRTNYQQLNRSISQPITSSTIPRITKDARKRHMRVIEAVMNQLERIWEQMQSVSAS
jgi:hypothetical protein